MASGGEELGPGKDGVEEDVADTQREGSDASCVGLIFKFVIETAFSGGGGEGVHCQGFKQL